jgi:sigma-B regulation protein RsbU (phosphoserine phosphatase)
MRANEGGEELSLIQVLVISPSQENRAALRNVLVASGLAPILCSSLSEGRKFLEDDDIRVVIFDDCLPDKGLQSTVEEMAKRPIPVPVIAVSRTGEWDECLAALRVGAFDYMALPPRRDEVDRVLRLALGDSLQRSGRAAAGVVRRESALQT